MPSGRRRGTMLRISSGNEQIVSAFVFFRQVVLLPGLSLAHMLSTRALCLFHCSCTRLGIVPCDGDEHDRFRM